MKSAGFWELQFTHAGSKTSKCHSSVADVLVWRKVRGEHLTLACAQQCKLQDGPGNPGRGQNKCSDCHLCAGKGPRKGVEQPVQQSWLGLDKESVSIVIHLSGKADLHKGASNMDSAVCDGLYLLTWGQASMNSTALTVLPQAG